MAATCNDPVIHSHSSSDSHGHSSPSPRAHSTDPAISSRGIPDVWHCPLDCGRHYQRSSGRSIRRHVTACFRLHNPATRRMSDEEVSALIGHQQESGQLVTGLRRWQMRRPRRLAEHLNDDDRWDCLWGCGKSYRATSCRSIRLHANTCDLRSDGRTVDVDVTILKNRRVQGKKCAKKRQTNKLFGSTNGSSSDTGGGNSEDSASNTRTSSSHPLHSPDTSTSTTQLVQNHDDKSPVMDGRLGWDTRGIDASLEEALHQHHHHHSDSDHQQQHELFQVRSKRHLSRLGSHGKFTHIASSSSAWSSFPSSSSSIAFSPTLLSSPSPFSWTSSASSASVDSKTSDQTQELPLLLSVSPPASVGVLSLSPPLSPVHQQQRSFSPSPAFPSRLAAASAAPFAAAAGSGVGTGTHALTSSSFGALPSVSVYPTLFGFHSSLSLPTSQSTTMERSSLHEQEQQVSRELCSLVTTLYTRHGLQHPVFQQQVLSPQLLERALATINRSTSNTTSSIA